MMNIAELIADIVRTQIKSLTPESQGTLMHHGQTVNESFRRLPLKYAMEMCFPQSYILTETFNGYRVELQLPQNCESGAPPMNTIYSHVLKGPLGENTTLTVMLTKDPEKIYTTESKITEFIPTHSVLKGDKAELVFILDDIADSTSQKLRFEYRSKECKITVAYTH